MHAAKTTVTTLFALIGSSFATSRDLGWIILVYHGSAPKLIQDYHNPSTKVRFRNVTQCDSTVRRSQLDTRRRS